MPLEERSLLELIQQYRRLKHGGAGQHEREVAQARLNALVDEAHRGGDRILCALATDARHAPIDMTEAYLLELLQVMRVRRAAGK
ncbi:hypothetical protein [Curtobacterium aurantiacum]|uniref:DUF222 domain-containing protein n=1 Tax=Curtobacterium aurantiacum TaxID=3236919 RepID=A0ABS5VFI6_9MICO|nr:hypothetical protein [Curtobacterium flaccumfaciens]MBT1546006.1 hypothetical protein [Curtobacterium flaccumfaciens pv. flaccumfaciens]MBT1588202.1 hypothetical protein [Curtobacterium flaccumfaciens pv. flaccumfaciens]MBT1679778.1 hypothetical protein [Curtobacterium flaccumfaciens pv. flaccumfaciens]